jgi:hypothetical protein
MDVADRAGGSGAADERAARLALLNPAALQFAFDFDPGLHQARLDADLLRLDRREFGDVCKRLHDRFLGWALIDEANVSVDAAGGGDGGHAAEAGALARGAPVS